MDIAALNKKVTFQKLMVIVDAYGNHTNGWVDSFTHHVTVGGESGTEESDAGIVFSKDTCSITTRWCKGTSSVKTDGYRVVLDGIVYNIESIDHLNYKKHAIKFNCRRQPDHER